jgi:hypothetical protein
VRGLAAAGAENHVVLGSSAVLKLCAFVCTAIEALAICIVLDTGICIGTGVLGVTAGGLGFLSLFMVGFRHVFVGV